MSISWWPTFSEGWFFAGFFLIGVPAVVSYLKGAFSHGVERFWGFTLGWGTFIALAGLWPLLVERVGYIHPLGSLSAGIALGFLTFTVGTVVVALTLIIIILLGHFIVEHIPPRTKTDPWS